MLCCTFLNKNNNPTTMKKIILASIIICIGLAKVAAATDNHYYQITLLRAHPGELPDLINKVKADKSSLKGNMLIMRHSQGDHWDLMLLAPTSTELSKPLSYQSLVDFQHDFLVSSRFNWKKIQNLSADSGLFHIEMFHAARGQYQALLKQRHMENQYLLATSRQANLIFETHFGSDVDLFTLGFYKNMQAFAAEPNLADNIFEKAAKDAGFKSRADIGFYLRQFLVTHQDTLATRVE